MSADGDTFDIDIYGDEAQDEQGAQNEDNGTDDHIYGEDGNYDHGDDDVGESHDNVNGRETAQAQHQTQEPSQGTKRKAPSDEHENQQRAPSHIDPSATAALKITDLHWWTTEEDLRAYCAAAQSELHLVDIAFGEHKINGKSRGEAYLEFSSPAAASAVKGQMENKDGKTAEGEPKRSNPFHIYFTVVGNPFKGRDSGAVGKKEYNGAGAGRGGAYNNFNNNNNNRGGFGGRGGGFNRGGGGFNRGGGYMNNNAGNNNMMGNQQWGMGNGGMGMGFGGNPMMAMGGYGNMGRGHMGGMMPRGGFGGMGNMGVGMMGMGGRGGGGMMGGGRGGWAGGAMMGGGMQPGYGGGNFGGGMGSQQGGQGGQQGQANKRMKAE